MTSRKIPDKTSKRLTLEVKILAMFNIAQDMPATQKNGIGKYTIKRALMFNDKSLRVSINTIKTIVDSFVVDGVLECSNPNAKTNFKFKLTSGGE